MSEPMSDEVMTIRQMCETYDVTPRTLRFYEAKELLFPQREGTRRLFKRSDQGRLKLILRGKRFGFSLEEIRQLLNLYNPGEANATQLRETHKVAKERLATMIAQRDELNEAIVDLQDQIQQGLETLAKVENNT